MEQYISKSAVMAEIEKKMKKYATIDVGNSSELEALYGAKCKALMETLSILDSLEVKEIETPAIPKHSYFEHIYYCGSEPMWKIGDVLAVYEFYSDHEGEYVYGKITDVKMDENEDWCYTFENGEVQYENMLISDEAYKKN